MALTVDAEIQKYLPLLGNAEKKSLLGVIKSFLNLKNPPQEDFISLEQYNKELDEAEAEIERGECHTHDEVIAMTKKLFNDKA